MRPGLRTRVGPPGDRVAAGAGWLAGRARGFAARVAWQVAALAGLALAGCASTPPETVPQPSGVAAPTQTFAGRLGLTVVAMPGGEVAPAAPRSASGLFELVGSPDTGRLVLTSPLGATVAEARWTPGEARLIAPEGERRYASLDALSTDLVGEPLPIGALFAWLQGRPAPGPPSRALADAAGFEQFGWRVDLARWADGRLRLTRDGRLRVELRLILEPVVGP